MKYICSVHQENEADDICQLLEANGVPVVRTNENTHNMIKGAKMKIDLWVAIESQYGDAMALIENPTHQVASPVDVAEFHQILEGVKNQAPISSRTIDRILTAVLSIGLAAFVAWVLWVRYTTSP